MRYLPVPLTLMPPTLMPASAYPRDALRNTLFLFFSGEFPRLCAPASFYPPDDSTFKSSTSKISTLFGGMRTLIPRLP